MRRAGPFPLASSISGLLAFDSEVTALFRCAYMYMLRPPLLLSLDVDNDTPSINEIEYHSHFIADSHTRLHSGRDPGLSDACEPTNKHPQASTTLPTLLIPSTMLTPQSTLTTARWRYRDGDQRFFTQKATDG
jgi:hypothetical protein